MKLFLFTTYLLPRRRDFTVTQGFVEMSVLNNISSTKVTSHQDFREVDN